MKMLQQHRNMLFALSLWELRIRYAGTYGGMIWSIILPLTMAVVYWFVFAVGLRAQGPDNTPYILWFMCGFITWTLFNETLVNSMNSITRNINLVKNIAFPLELLPTITLMVSQITHLIMVVVLFALILAYHIEVNFYTLQFLYYFIALTLFSYGFALLLSAFNVFLRDLAQAITVILNIWFWLTPIVWVPTMLPASTQKYLLFNPMYYIVNGYRDSFLYHKTFWSEPQAACVFWIITGSMLSIGWMIFNKFKTEFADAL